MTLVDENNIAGGDPGLIRAEAARLGSVCDQIAGVVARLRAVTTRGVWDSGAGDVFVAQVGEVPAQLDAVRARLQTAADLLQPYAGLLEDAQQRMRHLETRYTHSQMVVERCDRQLEMLPPEAPERPALMARRGEAAEESYRIQETHQRVGDEIRADEKRLAARLYDVAPELDDPQGYDLLSGLSAFGSGPIVNNVVTDFVRPVKFAGLAAPAGDIGLLLAYDQGSWATVARSAKTALLEVVKMPEIATRSADYAARQSKRGAEVMAATAGLPTTKKGKIVQTTAQVKVRAKHLAEDTFEEVTGIRLITTMTTNWAALSGAGRLAKAKHIAGFTAASVQQVDATVGRVRTTGDVVRPLAEPRRQPRRRDAESRRRSAVTSGCRSLSS